MRVLDMFKKLKEHVGKKIDCEYWYDGKLVTDTITLAGVKYYDGIEYTDEYSPFHRYISFIGSRVAIKTIKLSSNNEVLYHNPTVGVRYDKTDIDSIDKAKARFYGDAVALKQRRRRINRQQDIKMDLEQLNKLVLLKKSILKKKGLNYVKEELKNEWSEYVDKSVTDSYSCSLVDLAVKYMEALSSGKSQEEIDMLLDDRKYSEYTILMVVRAVSYFTNLLNKDNSSTLELKNNNSKLELKDNNK
ncbi:MAG: hypothetical protein IJK67_02655 [Bacilli bacterium]|nr:hypothetical protein [Bacilli bacterium]